MIKMPKLARECLAGNGVHRSGVKMPAMHLHTAGLDSCAVEEKGWCTGYSQVASSAEDSPMRFRPP